MNPDSFFNCTDSERAAFEAGIKLGSLFHQFIGIPVSKSNVSDVERLIETCLKIQPFVEDIKVRIKGDLKSKKNEFDYDVLSPEMLDVRLKIKYKNVKVCARLQFIEELDYPLMFVERMEAKK